MAQDRSGGTSRTGPDLPISPFMRLRIGFGLLVSLLALGGLGCRRPTVCPPGTEEIGRPGAEGFWCRNSGTQASQYVQLHEGTRQWRQRCPFQNGTPEGVFEAAHPGGQRWIEGRYQAGVVVGKWVQWNPTGQKVAEGEYRDGKLISGAPVAIAAICATIPRLQ
jgi:hypothetical protein